MSRLKSLYFNINTISSEINKNDITKIIYGNQQEIKIKETFILFLRGHIRNSFSDNNLYLLVKGIYNIYENLEIVISTFNIVQNNISWRKIDSINVEVDETFINNYFKDLSHLIKIKIITDDSKINLIGNLTGNVANSKAPLIGWKNYWYSKFKGIEYINNNYKNKNIHVLNLRFDIFNNSNNIHKNYILKLLHENKNTIFKKNIFYKNYECPGIDNIYMGSIFTQYKLISKFYYKLDDILKKCDKKLRNQEFLVFRENKSLFLSRKRLNIYKIMFI